MDKSTFAAVRIAVYVGGHLERGIIEGPEADDEIKRLMEEQDIAAEHFHDIQLLTYDFLGFGDNVRAAERKKRPITKFVGEILPAS
jgi:hypothetical protein